MTPEQIKSLQDFVSSLQSEITQRQLLVDGANALLKIATDGYQTDQTSIATEVQKGKDAVAEQVANLTQERDALVIETNDKATALAEKDATIADLTSQVEAQTKIVDPVQKVDSTVTVDGFPVTDTPIQ